MLKTNVNAGRDLQILGLLGTIFKGYCQSGSVVLVFLSTHQLESIFTVNLLAVGSRSGFETQQSQRTSPSACFRGII